MFTRVRLRGAVASILWGYRTAAALKTWTVTKAPADKPDAPPTWTLSATIAQADGFQLRQRPLMFSAPRPGGFWCWPVLTVHVGPTTLIATLGPPEQ